MRSALSACREAFLGLAGFFIACFVAGSARAEIASVDVIDWSSAAVDLSFLNQVEKPAGRRGFVKTRGDALVFADGSAARFWGTNISAATLFLSDEVSVIAHAKRMSRLGFNLVRLHHHDSPWSRPNIFGPAASSGTRRLDPAMLARIDWWIKCLKDEGIYVWLDLHVMRELHKADGIADFDDIARGKGTVGLKGFNYVDDDIEDAMKAFNEAYLSHVNAYTGLAYKDDPGIAAVLITNENDLTHHYGNALLPDKNVPKHGARYMAQARAFARTHQLPADRVWRSWERGPSKIFLNDLEHRFNARMVAHLRSIGVKVPIVTTSLWGAQNSSLPALLDGDMIDVHAYEDPGFLERPPEAGGNSIHTMAMAQLAGMPLSVTEWNMTKFPDVDRMALPLYVAATAVHQGWDALMHYAYAQNPLQQQVTVAASNWHALNDPTRLAMLPAAALLYRQRHVQEAATIYSWSPSESQLFDGELTAGESAILRIAAERGRLVTSLPRVSALPWLRATPAPAGSTPTDKLTVASMQAGGDAVTSANGQLRRNWADGIFSIDAPRTQAACGRLGGRSIELTQVTLRMKTPRVSVAVQALDDQPIQRSNDILISMASPSTPSERSQLPFMSEPPLGDIEIHAGTGLTAPEQKGVQVSAQGGHYIVHLDGTVPTHWVRLRQSGKAAR